MGIRHLFALLTILFIYSATSQAHQNSELPPSPLALLEVEKEVTPVAGCENLLNGIPSDTRQYDEAFHVVLDTNTIVNDPHCIFNFGKAKVIIPIVVYNELNAIKDRYDDPIASFSARKFFNHVRAMTAQISSGQSKDMILKSGGTLIIDMEKHGHELSEKWHTDTNDIRIIQVAHDLMKDKQKKVVFVTADGPAFIQAVHSKIPTIEYFSPYSKPYTGVTTYLATAGQIKMLASQNRLELPLDTQATENQFVILKDRENPEGPDDEANFSNIGRVVYSRNENGIPTAKFIQPLINFRKLNSPILPRNIEQAMAMDLLFEDPEKMPLVTLDGPAGTGKTLLSITAGLFQTIPGWNGGAALFDEMLVSRHIITMGKDIGALPGDGQEKVTPFLQPYFDNVDALVNHMTETGWRPKRSAGDTSPDIITYQSYKSAGDSSPIIQFPKDFATMTKKERTNYIKKYKRERNIDISAAATEFLEKQHRDQQLKKNREKGFVTADQILGDQRHVTIEVLSFIRGRSLAGKIFIIDEAQNLSSHEIQTIITRAGKGTKIILIGDVGQIDAKLGRRNNGLTIAVNLFRDQALAGHMSLTKGERSPLSDLANRLYNKLNGFEEAE